MSEHSGYHHEPPPSSSHRRRVPPPPPSGPPPTSQGTPGGGHRGTSHSSSHSFSSIPSIIGADRIEVSVTRSGDNSPVLGGMSPRTATNGTTGTGLRRRGAKKPTTPQEEPGDISVPAGTPFNESFTEVNRQKSNENLMAELENEMIKITGRPDQSSLGPAHPANRHYTSSSSRSQKSSPPTSSVVSKSNQSRGGDSTYQTSHSASHTPNGGSSLVLSRHNSQQDIILPDYEEDVDFNSGPDSVDAGRSLEDHVKMLQAELDAATIATAESGEMYDYHRRAEDRLEGTRYQSQSDAVSVLSAGDPVDDFDNNDGDYYEKLDEGGGGGRSIGRRAGSRRGSSSGSGHDGRRVGGGAADRRRGGKRTTSINRPNTRDFDGKFDGNTPVSLSIKEILLALVVVATVSFGGGYLFSSWVVHPSYLDDDTCTPSPHRIQESATYQMLLTKYESARKEISSLRISAMEDKEFHYKETSLKTKELLKKAEEHTDIVNRHAETMKTTMELQQKLTSVEQMYTDKIRDLEEQVKKREEEAVNNAAAKSVSSSSSANEGSTGMEQLNPMADSVQARDAQWRKHDLQMASKIARNSHRAVLQQWGGGGPFRIEFVLQFPGEQGHAVGNRIIIETAPLGMMPHAVHMFLEMAKGGLYTGTKFNFAGSDTVTVNIEHDNDVKKTFGDYTPALSFPEYNDHFPHAEYTLGFMGRDPDALPGPSFFINTKDNREKHGPQEGQFNEHGFNIGAYTCFAKVVAGKHVVDRIAKRARYGMHGGEEGILLKPVEIINTFVHMI